MFLHILTLTCHDTLVLLTVSEYLIVPQYKDFYNQRNAFVQIDLCQDGSIFQML